MFEAVQTWLRHIRALSEDIGPRGSTTEGERRGAEYCRQALVDLGYTAQVESFSSARSISSAATVRRCASRSRLPSRCWAAPVRPGWLKRGL